MTLAGTIISLCLGGRALSQALSQPALNLSKAESMRRLLGMQVEDLDGEPVGVLQNFLVNVNDGTVSYGLVATRGFAGIGAHAKAVPIGVLSKATVKEGVLELGVNKSHWDRAPQFSKKDLAKLAEPQGMKSVYATFEQPWSRKEAPSQVASSTGPALRFGREIVGATVLSKSRERFGSVVDLQMSFSATTPCQAVIETEKGKTVTVPLRQMTPTTADTFQLRPDALAGVKGD